MNSIFTRLVSVVFVFLLGAFCPTTQGESLVHAATASQQETSGAGDRIGALSIQTSETKRRPVDLTTAITEIAKETLPKVVYVEVTESQTVVNPLLPFQNDPFFRHFFGAPKMPKKFKHELKGLGTGIIIDAQGHILTNHHVAGGATKIEVTLSDGSKYPAKLVGTDPKTDIAIIKISPKEPLLPVVFGDSDAVAVGEWVVAIGAPRALEKSVTQGIISAKHRRRVTDPNSYEDFLQTDAAINPGNSGGPLLNLYGEVIGVNAAIASESGGFEGIGFTIPSNIAVYVAKALITHGKVERGWLGVTIRDLTPELAESLRSRTREGALIADVVKGGPAEKAGLRKNDIVIAYNGKDISDSDTFRNDVAETSPGQMVKIIILRLGSKESLSVRVESQETATKILEASVKELLGLEVRRPSAKEIEKYALNADQGVVVKWLAPKSPFTTADFEVGDMILALNDQLIADVENFVALASTLKAKEKISVLAIDHRTGNRGTVLVVVP